MSLAGLALRNANAWWDLQFAAARNLWRLQTEAGGMADAPDYAAFVRDTQQGARDLFAQTAAQMLANMRHAAQMLGAIHLRLARLAQAQTDDPGIGLGDGVSLFGVMTDAASGRAVNSLRDAADAAAAVAAPHRAASRTPLPHAARQPAPSRPQARHAGKTPRRGNSRGSH